MVGTGNVGTAYGWAFSRAGHRVTHLLRKGRTAPAAVRLDILDERNNKSIRIEETYVRTLTDVVPEDTEFALVALPPTRIREAVGAIAAGAPNATIAVWELDWNVTSLDDIVSPDRVIRGFADGGGACPGADSYVLNVGSRPRIDNNPNTPAYAVTKAALSHAGFSPEDTDMEPWLRVHCALMVPYWLSLAPVGIIEPFLRDPAALRTTLLTSREIIDLSAARGMDLSDVPDALDFNTPAWLFPYTFRLRYHTSAAMRRTVEHALDSIPEGIALGERILDDARSIGRPMPLLEQLYAEAMTVAE